MKIPNWMDVKDKLESAHGREEITALEQFVYDNEPAGRSDAIKFRDQLAAVIAQITKELVPR